MSKWLIVVQLVLQLIVWAVKRADDAATEQDALDALQKKHKKRVDAAVAARDAVLDGSVPEQPDDPNRRD